MNEQATAMDAIDAAMDAAPRSPVVFGQVKVDTYFCVLRKGTGKVPFDPSMHSPQERYTSILLIVSPLPGSNQQYDTERNMLAESKEWANFVKPSLRALNTDLRNVNGKWVQVELVPTGESYTNKAGEKKSRTTIKFIRVFKDEDACMDAANLLFYGGPPPNEGLQTTAAASTAPIVDTSVERETAKKFLPSLWKVSNGDPNRFADLIANNKLTAKYFDLASPEVVALMVPF